MRKLMFLTIAVMIGLAAGCSSDKGTDGSTPDVIMPLGPGNTWTGTQHEYDSTGAETGSGPQIFFINEDSTISGERWFAIAGAKILLANRDDGLWIRYGFRDAIPLQDPVMYAKYPATVGESWQSGDSLTSTVTVLSTDSVITVPRGAYKCYLYQWERDAGTRIDNYFLAPKVGWVRLEYYKFTVEDVKYLYGKWELDEFDLN